MCYRQTILIIWALILITISYSYAEISPLMVFPQSSVRAGSATTVKVYFHNEGQTSENFIIPLQLQLIINEHQATPQTLSAFNSDSERSVSLAPGQFISQTYHIAIPADLDSIVSFTLAGFSSPATTMVIQPSQAIPTQPVAPAIATDKSIPEPSIRDLQSLYRPYDANFSAHEPTYFVIGTDPSKSKFQLSFKYRLFNPSGSLSRRYPWVSGFHLGYTQTSFWDLDAESLPFEDTSYKPEFMYQSSNLDFRPNWLDAFFIQTAFQHESNGRGGDSSRSTNYFYTKPIFAIYNENNRLGIMVAPKFLYYYNNDDDTNPDLADYRGYVDLEVKVGKAESLMLSTNTRFAKKGTSFQADLSYPISRLLGNNFDVYLQLQYSNALAESLLHYTERTEALRLGIALVR